MHLYGKKDEENGCWVFYQPPKGMKVPARTGPKVDPKGEVACEKVDGGNEIFFHDFCFTTYTSTIIWQILIRHTQKLG